MTTQKPSTTPSLPTIGAPFGGGFFAGRFYDGDQPFALILAPKAEGELVATIWHTDIETVKNAQSYSNGPANTAAMAKAGSPLGKWARGITIGGFSDWYIPARLEALVLFGELRGINKFNAGAANGFGRAWYWTSTQVAGDESSAWGQSFGYDGQYYGRKTTELRARAVRRLPL